MPDGIGKKTNVRETERIGLMPYIIYASSFWLQEERLNVEIETEKYKNEFTYLAAYSLIKEIQEQGKVENIILKRLNDKCAETMGCKSLPL